MDQKNWLWKKKHSEKTIVTPGEQEQEEQSVPSEKEVEMENSLKELNEKLASVLEECSAKDELVQNHLKIAEEAVADKQKAEEEIVWLKQELDEIRQQKATANERVGNLNSALKDSMNKLNIFREEEHQRVQDSVIKAHKKLEEKLSETSKSLADLKVESSYLSKAIVIKDKLIEDLNNHKSHTGAEFEVLMSRLDTVEKENAFLRYEVRSFEKELDLRNEELEYSQRSFEASQKKSLENVKKIKKLEAECQRLRALTRKRHQNLAILPNLKSGAEVERNQTGMRGRKDIMENSPARDTRAQRCLLVDLLRDLEKENDILKQCVVKKEDELVSLRNRTNSAHDVVSLTSGCGVVDSFEVVCSNSFSSEMSLMDDFVEMEKLAIVAINPPVKKSSATSESHMYPGNSRGTSNSMTKDLVPVENKAKDSFLNKPDDWLVNVANVILEQHGISKRSVDKLLGDIKMVLNNLTCTEPSSSLPISGYITWKSTTSSPSLVENQCKVRDEFKKHLGGDGPGTAFELESVQKLMFSMEKICSNLQSEVNELKNELKFMKSAEKDHEALTHKLEKSQQNIASMSNELECLKESKRDCEDQVENQKLINEDLETQLSITKVKLNEALQKLSTAEVELDDKSHCCEEMEGTCLDLQLQLESITRNRKSEDNENHEDLLQTGMEIMEITKASARLEECEQTILKLGKQLKALGSTKELAVVEKALSITDTSKQRSSLHEILFKDEEESKTTSGTEGNNSLTIQGTTPKAYLHGSKSFKSGALVTYPNKNKGGMSFLRKLLRKKKSSSKSFNFYYGM